MFKRLTNLYQSKKYAVWWTAGYIACTYCILKFMFNFSIFSRAQWIRLMHAHLVGFPGLVFGILVLAMVPLYVATTAIVLRTGKPLLTIPMPKLPAIMRRATPAPTPEPAPAPTPAPNVIHIADDPTEMPPGMPVEMRAQYLRARRYGPQIPIVAPKTPHTDGAAATDTQTVAPGELPIPSDFDFDIATPQSDMDAAPNFAPVFSDIDFDTPDIAAATPDTDSAAVVVPAADSDHNAVINFLNATGREFIIEDDIIISGDIAIAAHTDPDFWIADDAAWFATGKTRPSPIVALNAAAALHNARPVLYLGATNIMDLDARRAEWESAGITVVTDLNEIFDNKKSPAKREALV